MTHIDAEPTADQIEPAPVIRRPMLLEAGEPLIVARSPVETAIRFGQWLEVSGMPPDALVMTNMSPIPLPAYPETWPGNQRRWKGTRAEIMWHPLMWLPRRVAHRYMIDDPDGGPARLESDEEWSVRVGLELVTAGLYEEATGGWVDILALAGIDAEDPEQIERVAGWLNGTPDEVLDHIDIGPLFDYEDDPDWASAVATAWVSDLRIIAWATQADDLVDYTFNVIDLADRWRHEYEEFRWTCTHIAKLSMKAFEGLPEEFKRRYEVAPFTDPSFWVNCAYRAQEWTEDTDGGVDGLLEDLLPAMLDRLKAIRDYFWPEVEELSASKDGTGIRASELEAEQAETETTSEWDDQEDTAPGTPTTTSRFDNWDS